MKKNIWHPVKHHPELLVGQYMVPNFVSNSVMIKLSEDEYIVIGPGQPLLAAFLAEISDQITLHIIFPNAYHHMGVQSWLSAFPNAQLYASTIAIKQLAKKGFAAHAILSLEQTQPPLPQDYCILFPPGHRAGDVWIKKQQENENISTWITCDSFLNYQRLSNQPIARLMQRLLGAAPGLKISSVVKWFILDDRTRFKKWATERLLNDNPTTLIPSHGEVQQDHELANTLRQILEQRL